MSSKISENLKKYIVIFPEISSLSNNSAIYCLILKAQYCILIKAYTCHLCVLHNRFYKRFFSAILFDNTGTGAANSQKNCYRWWFPGNPGCKPIFLEISGKFTAILNSRKIYNPLDVTAPHVLPISPTEVRIYLKNNSAIWHSSSLSLCATVV